MEKNHIKKLDRKSVFWILYHIGLVLFLFSKEKNMYIYGNNRMHPLLHNSAASLQGFSFYNLISQFSSFCCLLQQWMYFVGVLYFILYEFILNRSTPNNNKFPLCFYFYFFISVIFFGGIIVVSFELPAFHSCKLYWRGLLLVWLPTPKSHSSVVNT